MSGYLVTRWASSATDPLLGTSVTFSFSVFYQILICGAGRILRYARLIVITDLQCGHFISIIPLVGVILSSTRHPHVGHVFDTFTEFLFSSIFFIILHIDVHRLKRTAHPLQKSQPLHPDSQRLL